MNDFDEFDGIDFPIERSVNCIQPNEEQVLTDLMYLTDVNRLRSRKSITEFLKRIFLALDLPLNTFVDNYFSNGNIIAFHTSKGILNLDIDCLKEWIGVWRKLPGEFDFMGTTEDYLKNNEEPFLPTSFRNPLRKNVELLSCQYLKDSETVALFFTDMIEDHYFSNEIKKLKPQYSREPMDFICLEMKRIVRFNPLTSISKKSLVSIQSKIGDEKLNAKDSFSCGDAEERLREIIRIAYGIKNGYINPRGFLCDYNLSVDPYYFVSLSSMMDVYLKSRTFLDLYHYYAMYEWIDLLPQE